MSLASQGTSFNPAVSVNWHLYKPCNAKCRFCFATFRDVSGRLRLADGMRLLDALSDAGTRKINFVGGEPTLHPHIGDLLEHARSLGLVTSLVTNGVRLDRVLDEHAAAIDWVGLSIDSCDAAVQEALGRGADHVRSTVALADRCRATGLRLKVNTVVTSMTWREDMSSLIRRLLPERWKVFQVLPVEGQNDGAVEELLITRRQFCAFVARHRRLDAEGLGPVVEDNDAMRGSYAMVDPLGRFFGNASGRHVYSRPILEVGVAEALSEVGFDPCGFLARGGLYDWRPRS